MTAPTVTVLVNRGCRHCLGVLDRIDALAAAAGVAVAAVDATTHPEVAARHGIAASPTILFPGRVAYPGVPDEATFTALARPAGGLTLNTEEATT